MLTSKDITRVQETLSAYRVTQSGSTSLNPVRLSTEPSVADTIDAAAIDTLSAYKSFIEEHSRLSAKGKLQRFQITHLRESLKSTDDDFSQLERLSANLARSIATLRVLQEVARKISAEMEASL